MRFELKLAWRYFRAKRKSLAKFTSVVAVTGIAAGVASLILAQALARGFQAEMQEKILAQTAHITIFREDGAEIVEYQPLKANLAKIENVRWVQATTYESALVTGEKATGYCVLRVIENAPNQLSVGKKLAEKAGLTIGNKAEIITSHNDSAKNSRITVGGTFETGLYDYDSTWIYLSPTAFNYLFDRQRFAPTVLTVSLSDIYQARETAGLIRQNLGDDFKVMDWQEANQPLFAALSLERRVSLVIISLIILIAVLNITTTLALLVNERRLDIAILRTCGAKTGELLQIFLIEGFFLSWLGIIFGLILGLSACAVANYWGLVSLNSEVYSISRVILSPEVTDVLLITAIALGLSMLATLYPAWRAARIKPLENLRRVG